MDMMEGAAMDALKERLISQMLDAWVPTKARVSSDNVHSLWAVDVMMPCMHKESKT